MRQAPFKAAWIALTLHATAPSAGAMQDPADRKVITGSRAQTDGTIAGKVTEQETGAPVVGATVTVVATRLGSTTDDLGQYRIAAVPIGPRIVSVRRIGYAPATEQVSVGDGSALTVNFALKRAPTQLEEVVTTATGEQRKIELGHTIGVVRADSLRLAAPVSNISDALTSRVAGVMINSQNGLTGTVSPIRIRGLNSFTISNNPIVIVDGARIEGTPSTSTQAAARLGDLSMDEIESLEVVKGPSAATLYGTDAANGVLVIRTKRGQAGQRRWELFGEGGLITQPRGTFHDNVYAWGHTPSGQVVQCPLGPMAAGTCVQDSITRWNPLINDETSPLGLGSRRQVGVQTSGGVAQFTYFASAGFDGELGFMEMPKFDRELLKVERLGAQIPQEQLRPNYQRKVNVRVNMSTALGSNADLSLSNSAVTSYFRAASTEAFRAGYWSLGYKTKENAGYAFGSRMADYFAIRNAEDLTRYISSLSGNWRPSSWLVTRATLGLDFSNNLLDRLQRNGQGPPSAGQRLGSRTQSDNTIHQYSFDAGASAQHQLSSSISSVTSLGVQYNRREQVITQVNGTGLPPGSQTVAGAATLTGSETHADAIVVGSFLEEKIGWREKLFATVAFRADGASTFGRDLKTTVYPKVAVSWLTSAESFFPKLPGVDVFRLRAAFGASGVQPPSTAAISSVSLANASVNNVSMNAVTVGGTTAGGAGSFGNPGVRPERQSEIEGGFDLEVWGGRASVEATYFSKESTDALLALPYASSVGGGSRYVNIGSVTNKGAEALLHVRPLDREMIAFDLTLNGSITKNKFVTAGPDVTGTVTDFSFIAARHKPGYPLFGIWQRPILRYGDANNNSIIEATEVDIGAAEEYLGPSLPQKQLQATNSLSLFRDQVRLTALVDWRGGFKRLAYTGWVGCVLIFNCPAAVDRNAPLKDQAAVQAYLKGQSTNHGFIFNGAFTRIRELSASLRLPRSALQVLRARAGTLALSARNVAIWSDWPDGDPEVNVSTGGDLYYTFPTPPLPRIFLTRVSLSY
ncbi:MAG: TonB-dependent receptor plug domain-containing protein [Gemmatimonadaceae bacterium]